MAYGGAAEILSKVLDDFKNFRTRKAAATLARSAAIREAGHNLA